MHGTLHSPPRLEPVGRIGLSAARDFVARHLAEALPGYDFEDRLAASDPSLSYAVRVGAGLVGVHLASQASALPQIGTFAPLNSRRGLRVDAFAVAPEWRGRGLTRLMRGATSAMAARSGFDYVWCEAPKTEAFAAAWPRRNILMRDAGGWLAIVEPIEPGLRHLLADYAGTEMRHRMMFDAEDHVMLLEGMFVAERTRSGYVVPWLMTEVETWRLPNRPVDDADLPALEGRQVSAHGVLRHGRMDGADVVPIDAAPEKDHEVVVFLR